MKYYLQFIKCNFIFVSVKYDSQIYSKKMTEATPIKLKPEIIEAIRGKQRLKNRMLYELNMSEATLYRLLRTNSDDLTKATALNIISEELSIKKEDLLTA